MMKLEGSINGISIQKTGVKVTFMLAEDNKQFAMETLSKFVDKPITLGLLVDAKKVMDDFDKISDDQRKKIYAVIKEFANEYGDTEEETKAMLKESCHVAKGTPKDMSFSDCTKEQASVFLEFVLEQANAVGYNLGSEHREKDTVYNQCVRAIESKTCVVCKDVGMVLKDYDGRICLCEKHAGEARFRKSEFMAEYHLVMIK